jgi:hypothetical protein
VPSDIDRRRFIGLALSAVAGAAVLVTTGPEFVTPASATVTAKGPNLVFDGMFELDAVGSGPRGWIIS